MRHRGGPLEWLVTAGLLLLAGSVPSGASAQRSISYRAESRPHPGIRMVPGRFNQSATVGSEFYAAFVHLCTNDIAMAATAPRTGLERTSSWASNGGITLAVNGDFYESVSGSWHAYGDAAGNALEWPAANTGRGLGSWHWAHNNWGWIAFGPGWADFTHTEHVKVSRGAFRAGGYSVDGGWRPDMVAPPLRPGTYNLISGFPELVIEGRAYTCPDPTGGCFPDRGDMLARHPRTAIGLSSDRRTVFLVVVGGRGRRASVGADGQELAWLMAQLGAWQALNLDGGGSSTMWLRGTGIINSPSDGSERSVLNHVGVFAGSAGATGTNCCAPEVCNGLDDDCDGVVDNGVTNACGSCGPVPTEVCNGADDDCDGAIDEGTTNACGGCGSVPVEVCNAVDDDCDGAVDEGVCAADAGPEPPPDPSVDAGGGPGDAGPGFERDAGSSLGDSAIGTDARPPSGPGVSRLRGGCSASDSDARNGWLGAWLLVVTWVVRRRARLPAS